MLKPDRTPPDRHFKVTPLDLRQMNFKTVMRGFDKDEVAALLLEVADDYERVLRENDRLCTDMVRLDAALNQHRELEGSLKTTLMSAQKVADDMRENANQEAQRIVREAEGRADLLMQKTQARLEEMQREIDALRLKRRDVENSLEGTITTLRTSLEFIREQGARDEKVVALRPRIDVAAAAR